MRVPRRVLVVKLAGLGDLLTSTPALRALRTSFPAAHIGVLATPASATALRGLDSFDQVMTFDKFAFDRPSDALRSLPRALTLAADLRGGAWDTLVLLHHLTTPFGIAKYAALSFASGAKQRVGLDNGRGGWFLTDGANDRGFGWRHEVDYCLDVVSRLGARHPHAQPRLELCVAPDDAGWADARWEALRLGDRAVVLLMPGSGAFSRARRWSPSRFVEVARTLQARHGLTPLVLSGLDPDEQALAQQVAQAIGPATRVAPSAPSPQALGALIRRCRLLVGNDGGSLHVATAVGTPVVALFGPTNAPAWGPYPTTDQRNQVVRQPLACSPCIHRGHAFGTPQGCPARTCLAIVEVADVVAAAERALAASSSRQGGRRMSLSTAPSSGTLRCARHPKTETVLRCGRCETPICPRCLVATPVGARCPTCAGVKRFSMLLKPVELIRAIGFGLAGAAIGTIVLSFIPFLGVLGYAALGFGVGEAVSVGANRKRVRELPPVAVACLLLGYELGLVLLFIFSSGATLSVGLLLVPIFALGRGLLGVGLLIGALLAWMRVR